MILSGVLFLGTLGAAPAFAEEPVPVAAPTADATPAPEATASDDAHDHVEETSSESEAPASETPVAATDAPDAAAGEKTILLTGSITPLSNQAHGDDAAIASTVQVFHLVNQGYIQVDFTATPGVVPHTRYTVAVDVPAALDLGSNATEEFEALAKYSADNGALVATAVTKAPTLNGMVNQTPATPGNHRVYSVLVTPRNGAVAADQTAAKATAAVAQTSAYWSEQSGGAVTFSNEGTVPWYASSFDCATEAGSVNLWNQAAQIARNTIGYKEGANNHLALFFPGTFTCGSWLGLGSVPEGLNVGGVIWSLGTDTPMSVATLTHELGHNLTLGHANRLDCTSATPVVGTSSSPSGCSRIEYSDVVDVMGFGITGKSGGALSSPQGVRAGIWPAGSYTLAPKGSKSYTLNAVSSNTGLRSVVIEDTLGVNYFVEFRNFTGRDAQFSGYGCAGSACVAAAPGVRILRLDPSANSPYKGLWGDGSDLIGRTVGGVKRVNYTQGESWSSAASGGISVTVTAVTATSATVSVTRPANGITAGTVTMARTSFGTHTAQRVGDTMTAVLGSSWEADSYAYKWYRSGKVISGATKQSYVLTSADKGKNMRVTVTGIATGTTAKTVADPPTYYIGYEAVQAGVLEPGTAKIVSGASGLVATPVGWTTPSTAFAYQWYRGDSAGAATTLITGATKSTYLPTSADVNKFLRVKVTGSKAGYNTVAPTYSPAAVYTSTSTGTAAISGTAQIGLTLSANALNYTADGGVAVASPTRAHQWLRSGVAIAGATASTYTPVAADFAKTITVRITGGKAGYAPHVSTSAPTAAVLKGVIVMNPSAVPVITKSGLVLAAAFPAATITETGTVTAWQWFRDGAAIATATKASYTLTSADYNKSITVRATVTKLNYITEVRTSVAANHSVLASGIPTISGIAQVGRQLVAGPPTYSTIPSGVAATVTYQWYRSGVAISGATASSYTLVAADYAKVITVRATGAKPTFLSASGLSAATSAVVRGVIAGSQSAATVTKNSTATVLTATPTAGAITESGVAYAYQWYRNGVAISKATKSTFAVTTLDRSKSLHVRIIVTKLNYTSVTLLSTPTDYSVIRSVAPAFTGDLRVGGTLTVNSATYKTYDQASVAAAPTYQWYRSGVAIAGATGTSYTLVAADYTKLITVRVAASWTGYLPYVITSAASAKVAPGLIAGPNVVPTVARSGMVLTATAGSVGEPGVAYAYQWYRSGAAIAKATKASYTLTSLDAGKTVYVRQLATKLNYTSVALLSAATNYSVQRTVAPVVSIVSGGVRVAGTVGVNASTYFTLDGAVGTDPKYQWYRSGVAIAGATAHSYVLTTADLAKLISVRVTVTETGYLPYVVTTPAIKVAPGIIQGSHAVPILSKDDATLVVTAALPAGSITETGTKLTWQWYRAGVAIPKATAATFRLTAVDYNKVVHARATVTKSAYTSVVLNSAPVNSSVVPSSPVPVITGDVAIGLPLSIDARTYTNDGAETYQWLRAGVAIPGAVEAAYTPVAADRAKSISVRVTAASSGFLPSISTSAGTQLVADNAMAGGSSQTPVPAPKAAGVLAITANDTVVTEPGAVKTHQWYRSGVAIAKATAATYTPVAADFGKLISVRVIYTKPTFTSVVRWSTPVAVSVVATGKPVISSTLPKRGVPVTVSTPTFTVPAGDSNVVTVTYQWYRSGKAISGATSATYKPVTADKGKTLTARVVATAPGLVPAILMSAATKALK